MLTQKSGTSGFKMFSCEDLDKIHAGALNILKNVGLNIESKEAAEIFQSAGAGIEKRDGVFHVNLDPNLVEDCLAKAPKNITFYGRDPNTDYVVEPGRTGFTAFGQCVNVLDPATAELRPAGKADMARSAILQDALENLRTTARTVAAGDQYPPAQAVHCMDAIVRNTGKHISGGAGNRQNLAMIIQLLEVAAGGPQRFHQRPFYSPSVCPTSPLTLGKDSCEVAISAAGAGLSVVIMTIWDIFKKLLKVLRLTMRIWPLMSLPKLAPGKVF
jgi:trimethylamine--corrinoid protein Co-methyltransferase